jgi:uncharacterized membrane protein YbhN (UPF0104 family)
VKRRAAAILGVLTSLFFLWLALRKVQFAALGAALAAASWGWLVPMTAIMCFDLAIRGARWRVLLSRAEPKDRSLWTLVKLSAIGLSVNNVLPLRLGEVARAALGARHLGVPVLAVLASVAIERALDVAALLTIFIGATFLAPGIVPARVVVGAGFVLGGAIVALVVLAAAESMLAEGALLERALRRWPKLHSLVEQLALGAAVLRSPSAAAASVAMSLLLWNVDAALYWAGSRLLGLGALMDYPRAVLTLSWAGASSAIPAAPGAIGTFEAVVGSILTKFGAAPEAAFAYALVTHMVMFLFVTCVGLLLLSREGVSLAQLKEEVERK